MTTVRLVVHHDLLHYPCPEADDNLLVYSYDSGEIDTIPWPLDGCVYSEDKLRDMLASALFDEREVNSSFPQDVVIELPDGTVFPFDPLVVLQYHLKEDERKRNARRLTA